jgi:hypothetical protein
MDSRRALSETNAQDLLRSRQKAINQASARCLSNLGTYAAHPVKRVMNLTARPQLGSLAGGIAYRGTFRKRPKNTLAQTMTETKKTTSPPINQGEDKFGGTTRFARVTSKCT